MLLKYTINGGTTKANDIMVRSARGVQAYIAELSRGDLDFGSLQHMSVGDATDVSKVLQFKKNVRDLGLSENSTHALISQNSIVPLIFHLEKLPSRAYCCLHSYDSWRMRTNKTGLSCGIKNISYGHNGSAGDNKFAVL